MTEHRMFEIVASAGGRVPIPCRTCQLKNASSLTGH